MEAPRSLKRKNFFSPSPNERDGHVAHILSPFEKRMRTAQWGAFQNVRAALFPSSLDPKGVALRDFYHGHGSSVGSFSPSTRLSPRALPSSVGPPFSPLALSSSGRPPRQALTIATSTVSSTFSSYPRFRDTELEALRLELKKHQEFSRGAMELAERAHARDLKQTAELEMFKLEVSKMFERRDAGHILSQMTDAGRPPQQEFQNLSGQTGGSNFLPSDNFRDISSSSVSGDGAVSVRAMPRGGSQSDEVNVPSSRSGREDNQEPEWKQLLNKANSKDKTTSLSKEIEYTLSKLQALQLERPSWFKVEKKPEDKTLVDAFTPLSAEAELAVDEVLGGGDRHEILVTHEKSNIDVTRAVMQCLSPGVWLNDEVINVYMELLKEREIREPDRFLKCHFFNTFFYNKLYKDKRSYDYKAIRRWTTQKKLGYSLSDCDKILVPIHQDIHWCLAVINIRDKRLEYLDSLKGGDRSVLDVLSRYITDEAKDKDGKVLDVSTWDQDFPKNIPEQLNGCDCGMFMVKYADFHSRGAPLQFTQDNMEYFRNKMVWEILDLKAT